MEWCDRRLLARIHRYTVKRLRAEIEPVSSADFLRFLARWQRLAPGEQMEGPDAVAAVIAQKDVNERTKLKPAVRYKVGTDSRTDKPHPGAVRAGEALYVQVASDTAFNNLVLEARVGPEDITPQRDYTIKIDLDGKLLAGSVYYYRFIYDSTVSRTGRCRTAPATGASLSSLKFGLLTCQDYTNGYYGALAHVARDDTLDFVLHLGDFIYETAGDPRFQSLPFADRTMILPSGGTVSMGLADYRFIYRTYRSDPNLQAAMERHTWIMVPDDHETSNDCYWDYARDTLGAPDHPYTKDAQYGNSPALLRQLKLESQRAWVEYVPARVVVNESATHPHDYLRVYRNQSFGSFLDLYLIENRTYRSAHPCGEGDVLQRYVPLGCTNLNNPNQTLLGKTQRSSE